MSKKASDGDSTKGFASKVGRAAGTAASKAVKGSRVAGGHVAGASGVVAERTVQGARVAAPHIARARGTAKEQATRAAALAAEKAKRRMPSHELGDPVRPAILDSEGTPERIEVQDDTELGAFALLSSQFLLADFVTSREQDETRWEKMERVLDRQRLALDEVGIGEGGAAGALVAFGGTLPTTDCIAFLVDLYFLDPFAPYTLKSDKAARMAALRDIAVLVGGEDDIVDRIDVTRRSALAAHTKRSLGKIGLIGIGAAVGLGVAGFL
ncbi:MAG: hypothetical protein M3132_10585, partial [Actinomycetia bacterium]|nr:hypothetical protein [Actinomycetes bacterium]